MRKENVENTRRTHERIDGICVRCDSRHRDVDHDISDLEKRTGKNETTTAVMAVKHGLFGRLGGVLSSVVIFLGKYILGR